MYNQRVSDSFISVSLSPFLPEEKCITHKYFCKFQLPSIRAWFSRSLLAKMWVGFPDFSIFASNKINQSQISASWLNSHQIDLQCESFKICEIKTYSGSSAQIFPANRVKDDSKNWVQWLPVKQNFKARGNYYMCKLIKCQIWKPFSLFCHFMFLLVAFSILLVKIYATSKKLLVAKKL